MIEFNDMTERDRFYLRRLYDLIGSGSLEKLVQEVEPMSPGWHFLDTEIYRQGQDIGKKTPAGHVMAVSPDKHARVFYSDGRGSAYPNEPNAAEGWHYAIGEEAPVGPFPTSHEAHNNCRDELVAREAGR